MKVGGSAREGKPWAVCES